MRGNGANNTKTVPEHFDMQNSMEFNTRQQRNDFVFLIKNWFDPRPQIKEMCQVVFWKDMFIEAMALGHILFAVILLLNTCIAVSVCLN